MMKSSQRRSKRRHTATWNKPRRRRLQLEQLENRLLLAGTPLFRIDAGGPGAAGDPAWQADTATSPSQYSNALTGNSSTGSTAQVVDISHASVPAGTPMALFQTERFDRPGPPNLLWDFPVTPGEYEVRLYFAETFSGAFTPGARVFDVTIEGATVLDNYDIFADVGSLKGVVKSFTVTSDANLDIDFLRVVQNPNICAIEIIDTTAAADVLEASTTSLDFGSVVVNNSASHLVMLRHAGAAGSSDITIDPPQAFLSPNGSPYSFTFDDTQPIVLSAGETTVVTVTYTPTTEATHTATLTIPHSGQNSPIVVSLTGSGVANIPINFTKSTVADAALDRPTKLQFGPDGRLYVAQQNGLIRIFDVVRDGPNDYRVASSEQLTLIRNMPNRNDDGALNSAITNRLVTGMLVSGTAQNPVIYVSSSDPRIGGGSTHEDLNLDTNSGVVSRLTWNGSTWVKLDLVRGLPRSEENHGTNGLALDASTNTLYVAVGGNTNMGAPSENFSLLPEYALSAAVLSIDLDMIGETTYDLPTLDDEDRPGANDVNDPFGGNDGKNQAIIVPNGPVQVYAPGFRNPYDLHITMAGRMYTFDNAPNAGWGGMPIGEGPGGNATNQVSEGNSITLEDQLHYIPGPGFYFGHPNPTRSNPNNTFNASNPQSPAALAGPNPIESDYLIPPTEDGSLFTVPASTNGIDEYTANTFGGQMQGDLIVASFDNTVKRIKLNASGNAAVLTQNLFSNVGVRPLDVDVADSGPWAGTVWVCDIGLDSILVYEPSTGGSGNPNDLDGDGYTNDDEEANGTDPNNAADAPPDHDMDFLSNLLDNNDDNDSLLDDADPFAVDADNGATTPIGTIYDFENEGPNVGGLLNMGFTGLMTNGVDDYELLFDPETLTAGGAAGVFTIDAAAAGTARGAADSQTQAFQFGVQVAGQSSPFTARSSLLAPFAGHTPQPGQEMGMYIGTGDQNNYVQIVLSGSNGGSVQVMKELGGVFTAVASQNLALPGPGFVDLNLTVNPVASTVQASYIADGGALVNLGAPIAIPAAWLAGSLAVGLIATDSTGANTLPVTWDFLGVEPSVPASGNPEAFFLINPPSGGLLSASVFETGSYRLENNSTGNVQIQSVRIDTQTALLPDLIFDPTGAGGNEGGKPFTPDSGAVETGLVGHTLSSPHDDGFDVLEVQFSDFDPGEAFTFSIDMEPTSIRGSAAPGPSSTGKISGLELNGATITIVFSDGTTTHTQTFRTAGIGRASQTTADSGLPPAPGLARVDASSAPAIVTDANQTLRVTGPAGSTARLLQIETGLYLSGVPDGGFDIDPFEANKAIKLTEYLVTIGSGGFVDLPVTLTASEPEAGYNYFVAAIQDAAGRTGNVSQKIILKLQNAITFGSAARVNVYPNGSLNNSSTATAGTFQILNQSTSGEAITSITVDLSTALLPDVVFDPSGGAGDTAGKPFTTDSGAALTGQSSHSLAGSHDGGFDSLTVNFTDFGPGETFTFSIDTDPTSVKGSAPPGPQQAASISGLELTGATITVRFNDGTTHTGQFFADSGSKTNSHVILDDAMPASPTLAMLGVSSNPAIVTNASQTVRISGPSGATARLLQTEGALFLGGVPNDGFDVDPFESNKVTIVTHRTVTIGSSGFVDVPLVLNDSHERGGVNRFVAAIQDLDGRTSLVSNFIVVALNDDPATSSVDLTGLLAGDYNGTGTVDNWDYMCWKQAYGDTGDGMLADGSNNGAIDMADYIVWRRNFGNSLPSGAASEIQTQLAQTAEVAVSIDDERSATTNVQKPLIGFSASGAAVEKLNRDSIGGLKRFAAAAARFGNLGQQRMRSFDLLVLATSLAEGIPHEPSFANSGANSDPMTSFESQSLDAWDRAFESLGSHPIDRRFSSSFAAIKLL